MNESTLEQASAAYQHGNPKEALQLAEKGLAADAAKLPSRERHELWVLKSHSLSALGQWKEALAALYAAQGHEANAEAQARLEMHKGYLMGSLARYTECGSLLRRAEQTARELGLRTLVGEVLWRRGMISIFAGDYASAASHLQSAFEIAVAERNRQLEGVATAGLAKNLMYCREYVKAIARFKEALAIFEELDFPFYVAITQGELGTCYMNLGETEKALELLESTAEIFLAKSSLSNYQVSLADIGSVYLRRGEFLTAISYYQRALELARKLGDQVSISKWLRNLSQAYSLLGNPTLACGFESEAESLNILLTKERERAARVAVSLK
jgi:tetratricopeptide (TPR) repeat protein